jgi:hypothetical protein
MSCSFAVGSVCRRGRRVPGRYLDLWSVRWCVEKKVGVFGRRPFESFLCLHSAVDRSICTEVPGKNGLDYFFLTVKPRICLFEPFSVPPTFWGGSAFFE